METNYCNWSVGEVANIKEDSSCVSKRVITSYEHMISSRYVCVREVTDSVAGVLVKVVGKVPSDNIIFKGGEPFVKDLKVEGFSRDIYSSYRFPTLDDLKLVLGIIRDNPMLIEKFEQARMHINPNSTFWVREIERKLLIMNSLQYFDARTGQLLVHHDNNEIRYRLSIAFFTKMKLILS